jgi:hypothetical protein
MKPIFYACLVIIAVVSSCSSGKTTFERGNYYEAVITSVNRLRKNSDHKKSVETLRQAYPMAVAFYEDRAKTSLASTERFKWTEVVKSYTLINNLYDEIKRCPGALAVVPNPVNYFSKLQEARQNAAEEHYAAGILALQGKTRDDAKLAYGYFKTANEYITGYKEVNDYMEAALAAATVKILVEPIPVHSRSVGVSAEFFNDKISEFVHAAPISEFVRFYTSAEAKKMKLTPDHIIQLQFDDFTVGEVYRHEKEIQLSRDSIVMGTYVSSPAPAPQSADKPAAPSNRSGLVVNGTGVLASTGSKVSAPTSGSVATPQPAKEDNQKALAEERLRAEREAAERQRAEKEAIERERALKEAAEREKAAKEAAEKALADKIASEKALADKAASEKAIAEKAAAEKALAEKERIQKEQSDRERIEKEQAEKALADKLKAEQERAQAEKDRLEQQAAEQRAAAEKAKAERERAEKEKIEKEKLEKEKLEKERIEKERLEKERVEKEKIESEKIAKDKYIDPTISAEDTLNVKDGVLVCHIPPGNKMNARTLKINRAALKAHLAHGDLEGGCEPEKNLEKNKPANQPKGKPTHDEKSNKGKGPGGSANIDRPSAGYSFLQPDRSLLIASASDDPADMLRYLDGIFPADTNKVYGTVKATLYHYTKTTTSKGIVSFRIIDAKTGALLSSEKMPGEFVWKSEWATFNGDERALSAEQLRLSKLKELPAPPPQDLFIEFTRPIYDQITTKIREFYRNY